MMHAEIDETEIKDQFAPHEPDLTGFSRVVKSRFQEAIGRTVKRDDFMVFPDGCEKGLIGTMVNGHGFEVPVYEHELSIMSKAESYSPYWATDIGRYTEEQLADQEYMAGELYTMAQDDFEYNTVRSLPYQHEHAPVIMDALHDSDERTESTRWDTDIVGKLDARWNPAFVGTVEGPDCEPVAVYEYGLMVDTMMHDHGVNAELAKTLLDNFLDLAEVRPTILYGFEVDRDRWDSVSENINDEVMEEFFNA
jgi:hypothetical protein